MTDRNRRWFIGAEDADDYDAHFLHLAESGQNMHGEAAFVELLRPRSVLDAGCGTGRVGRELSRRGIEAVGVDVDTGMISTARRKAPEMEWHLCDLVNVDLGRCFDAVLLAGNVMIFLQPTTERAVVENMVRHLHPGGYLVAGFQLGHGLTVDEYDAVAEEAGLQLHGRWATWDRQPWQDGGSYAVSVHTRNLPSMPP